jgi:5-methyltetrahydropteroyltriglutamate--homocysteine methyltransferase
LIAHTLGFPRIGLHRELKKATESFWKGAIDEAALLAVGKQIRERNWELQRAAGLDFVSVGDFSYYDHVLDTTALLGAVPRRFNFTGEAVDLATFFSMARGSNAAPAMEMTKWFDTNYHYIVPEFDEDSSFEVSSPALHDEFMHALSLGHSPKPVLLGPVSYLWLGKERGAKPGFSRLDLLEALLPVYVTILARLHQFGVRVVQLDEPMLTLDLEPDWLRALERAYATLTGGAHPEIMLATYFGSVGDLAPVLKSLPISALHVDLVRAPGQLDAFLKGLPTGMSLSLGVVDGRNVWRTDLDRALTTLERAREVTGSDRLWVAPSCSLLHSPLDLTLETKLDDELKSWMAFAVQKLHEVSVLKRALAHGRDAVKVELEAARAAIADRKSSPRIHNAAVKERVSKLSDADERRASVFSQRQPIQHDRLKLPPLPTTTIGSFPQTASIREARAKFRKGEITPGEYARIIQGEIQHAVRMQEEIGLDVIVHGEAERNDMVEYFGEQMAGFAFTENAWVQSYGSRYVKPPIIYGDVSRPNPMTISWITYAQSLTQKPLKGMLTGPVTILEWSFVRDDQPHAQTAMQLALAIRDEVADLERAGIRIIQIDEPAFREGLPLKRKDWPAYFAWATRAFRVASSPVGDATQIHTHMCYSEFGEIMPAIASLGADVITIESSRSQMELLESGAAAAYPNEIGPGVYDIHSPRIPSVEEIEALLGKAAAVLPARQLWVNPDCGLKTRRWEEVIPALTNMVEAARRVREKLTVVGPA